MFTRRLIILFIIFTIGFVALGVRLATFQLTQADDWSRQATRYIDRHYLIDTHRGTLFDCQNRPIARDEPADDLAIDFRAMTLDDAWITQRARERLKAMNLPTRDERIRALAEIKQRIAEEIDEIPAVIVREYDWARSHPELRAPGEVIPPLTTADIAEQYNIVRKRIHFLKQDQWVREYVKADSDNRDDSADDPDTQDDTVAAPIAEEMQAHTIVEDVPLSVKIALDKLRDTLPGISVIQSKRRKYPFGDVAAQVIGAMMAVDDKHFEKSKFERPDLLTGETGNLRGYLPGDRMGAGGMEDYLESTLRGSRGVGLRELGGADVPDKRMEPEAGRDVRLTLDMAMQKDVQAALYANNHELLKGQAGQEEVWDRDHHVAVVVLRIKDRAVVMMLSAPTFDLNDYQKNSVALNADEAHTPLLNRAMRNTYPAGSTVKPLVAAAALTEGTLPSPLTTVVCHGYLDPGHPNELKCTAAHGALALREALEHSCNVFFYTQGRNLGLDKMSDWYNRFGYGEFTGIGPGEAEGNVPDPDSFRNDATKRAEATELGIGQGKLTVTPLQMANAYATLLQGGIMQAPTLVADDVKEPRRVFTIAPEHLRAIRDGMELVVHGEAGTARSQLLSMKLPIAGKTGSALTEPRKVFDAEGKPVYRTETDAAGKTSIVYRRDTKGELVLDRNNQPVPIQETESGTDSWFVGYAPYQDPQYVVVAVKEFGGHGGVTAVPLVREAFLELERHGYLPNVDGQ